MTAPSAPVAGRREWIGLAVLALPCLLYSMDLTVLNLAVPHISADLQPTSAQLLWILDVYGFMVAGCLITMGTLGDRIGRRRLLLIGAAAFGIGSVLAAFSTSASMLIATRALLGVAGATLAPSTLSLIRVMFHDPRQRMTAIAIWGSSYSVGGAIGPLVGGLLLERFWWGSALLIGVPVMMLLLAVGPKLLPEARDPEPGRLDVVSTALSLAAVLAVIYGLKVVAQDGLHSLPLAAILAGLGLGAIFVQRQLTLSDPLIDLRLFRAPAFSASLAINTFSIFAMFGIWLFTAQYLQLILGLSPLQAGLWTLPSTVALVAGSLLAPMVVRRVRPVHLVAGGLALETFGLLLLTQIEGDEGLWLLVIASLIWSLGIALVVTLSTDLIVGSAPPERAGAASALSETSAELGGAVGIAVLGSIGTAVYRSRVAELLPAGLSFEAAATARDTLGGAVGVAAQVADLPGAALLEASRTAFVDGLHLAAVCGAVVVFALAIVTALWLGGERSDALSEPEPGPMQPCGAGAE
jgi:DHA2 family multidrug resistance protein-like MFS transporter